MQSRKRRSSPAWLASDSGSGDSSAIVSSSSPDEAASRSADRRLRSIAWLRAIVAIHAIGLAIVALVYAGLTVLAPGSAATPAALDIKPASTLNNRWGTYLSEREWGTPRQRQ